MEKTYLLIEIEGEENVGVIDAGVLPTRADQELKLKLITEVEPKLVKALEYHFACNVSIVHFQNVPSTMLEVTYDVIVKEMKGDRPTVVTLKKTWVY